MTDEEFYLLATNEVEGEQKKPALWAKVMALAEGDRDKAKYQYIKLRVAQLIEEKKEERPVFTKKKKEERPVFTKKIKDEFDIKYIPISEFSKIKSIPEKQVIEMVRDGFYVGRKKDNKWFVSRDEVGRNVKKRKTFEVYKHPTLGFQAVKIGFNWPAYFFGICWMLSCQLWEKVGIWIVMYVILFALGGDSTIFVFICIAIGLIPGFKGNEWRSSNLKSRGFELVTAVEANTKDKAIAKASNT